MLIINKITQYTLRTFFLLIAVTMAGADTLFDKAIEVIEDDVQLTQITENLGKPSVIRSQFQQKKNLKILRRPMTSNGIMVYSKEYGLYWHVEAPFPSTLVITESVLFQKDGNTTQTVTANSQPVLFGFSQVFFRLLSGDISALNKHFDIYFQKNTPFNENAQQWRIGLLPKQASLQQFISRVILRGDKLLESVQIIDNAGDSTDIEFTAIDIQSKQLTGVERSYFEF